MAKRRPRLYFSFRSPFSWMAVRQLEQRVPNAPDLIDYIPFFEPGPRVTGPLYEAGGGLHYVGMSKAKHLYILNDTKRLTAKFGYKMHWPIDVDPVWEVSHLAWIKAKYLGVQRELYQAVTTARWETGANVNEPDVLGGILEAAGLPVEPLVNARDDDDIVTEGVQALLSAYYDDVFGMPYFKIGREKFWGLDRLGDFLDVFLPTIEQAANPPDVDPLADVPAAVLTAVGAYDRDTAGGCG